MVLRLLMPLLAAWAAARGQSRLEELARGLKELEFDAARCYRVRELLLQKEDAKIYLTDGYLILSKPLGGGPVAAVFTSEVEGGEAEILLLPPSRGERMSLASFIETPNLEERFRNAVFLFTDGTGAELERRIAAAEPAYRRSEEMGLVLKQRYDGVARNLSGSFHVRALQDLMALQREGKGFFYAALGGARPGNFDLFIDQRARRLVTLGQVVTQEQGSIFNVWCQFEGRSWRDLPAARRPPARWDPELSDFQIEATILPDLNLQAVTRVKAVMKEAGDGVLPFEISSRMRITAATVDGQPAAVYQRESFRSVLMAGGQNELVLVVPAQPIETGRTYEVELRHEGNVIRDAGNGVYYVTARSNWYPQRGLQMARYDARFRYPKNLTLVSAGEPTEVAAEGDLQTSRWVTPLPVRMLGFNLGKFEHAGQTRGAYKLEVYANPSLERALTPLPAVVTPMPPPAWPRGPRRAMEMPAVLAAPVPPSPLARLEKMSAELAETLDFMATRLGPPPLKTLNVTPIPGRFGQGFPGLLYLSTLAYLDPRHQNERPAQDGPGYFEILQAHEVAHQWWGNLVTPGGGEDEWLMEALANYTALLFFEKKRGTKAMDAVLATYRDHLLRENEEGKTVESAGPIIWGTRLSNSQAPGAWQAITYEKGTWIMHMLRRRLGEAAFQKMLAEFTRRFAMAPLTNADLQAVAAEVAPPDARKGVASFLDTWVYGTGIPELALTHKVNAAARTVSGTITQKGVAEDFSAEVPVEIQLGRGRVLTQWVRTASEPVDFSVKLPPGVVAAQVKVALDPAHGLLRR